MSAHAETLKILRKQLGEMQSTHTLSFHSRIAAQARIAEYDKEIAAAESVIASLEQSIAVLSIEPSTTL